MVDRTALSATAHCLTGCATGEVVGLLIGTAAGFSNLATIPLSTGLAFVFGFSLSMLPLLDSGLRPSRALRVVVAADTVSIATMEVVDNLTVLVVPGALDAGLVNTVFWWSTALALAVAFAAAYPVNRWLIARGRGHALSHEAGHGRESRGWPIPTTPVLLGGFVVALAETLT